MEKKIKLITLLALISCLIYGLQIVIFHDSQTTFFYIFQDLAFIPISIAITTVVVGDIMTKHEKRDSQRKTKMLTSSFFTGIGASLMLNMVNIATYNEEVKNILLEKDERKTKEKTGCSL